MYIIIYLSSTDKNKKIEIHKFLIKGFFLVLSPFHNGKKSKKLANATKFVSKVTLITFFELL